LSLSQSNNELSFTTNFNYYSDLKDNPDWNVISYYPKLATYTLNIDEDLSSFLSKQLNTLVIDFYEYTVVDQKIIRSFVNGNINDLYFISDSEILEAQGYFEKLEEYIDNNDLSAEDLDEIDSVVPMYLSNFGINEFSPDFSLDNMLTRRPMYLKGSPDNILSFLEKKDSEFFYV